MKKHLIKFYLDWTNNWLTVSKMAEHYQIEEEECSQLIDIGRKYHEEFVEQIKSRRVMYESPGVGKSSYMVSWHDGVKMWPDGSQFFDGRLFTNKKDKEKFMKELIEKGYRKRVTPI